MKIVISDSSMLILVSKLDILDTMLETFESIIIPEGVRVEVVDRGKEGKKMDALLVEKRIDDGKILVKKISKDDEKNKLMNDFNIHSGEAEAVLLYLEEKADLLGTDDYQTLKTCKILNIHYFTTPLFLFQSHVNRKIEKAFALRKLERLSKFGWYKYEIIEYFSNAIKNVKS
jgi:predicted nucleic acid-binding protein